MILCAIIYYIVYTVGIKQFMFEISQKYYFISHRIDISYYLYVYLNNVLYYLKNVLFFFYIYALYLRLSIPAIVVPSLLVRVKLYEII